MKTPHARALALAKKVNPSVEKFQKKMGKMFAPAPKAFNMHEHTPHERAERLKVKYPGIDAPTHKDHDLYKHFKAMPNQHDKM